MPCENNNVLGNASHGMCPSWMIIEGVLDWADPEDQSEFLCVFMIPGEMQLADI